MYKKLLDIKRKSLSVNSIIKMIVFILKCSKKPGVLVDYQLGKIMGMLELNYELGYTFFSADEASVLVEFFEYIRAKVE